ncbi:OLC1v1002896C1 [Oldenlandia corymbosa var. corymbosa]|uniref:OLC1v1002896C1 n=1 Tax=Oldenlandia corymbosa var. corymbosa TaxID=529605 RepID=A0AAV1D8T7_OLDCO|nr:OLC1v1002896C1 [Oldenlandia corymbosa var. corymbosa]
MSKRCRGVLGIGLIISILVSSVFGVNGLLYDYSYSSECLATPLKPQYGGGMVVNPELNEEGLKGWSTFGEAKLAKRVDSEDGNNYLVAYDRKGSNDSLKQAFALEKGKLYVISAWLQVSHGVSPITAAFKTSTGNITLAGTVITRSGCWSMLKGGITPNASTSGVAELYFLSEDATVDIWADSISLQPFTQAEWESHQIQSAEKIRKSRVRFQAVDPHGQPLANTNISITQTNAAFPVGSAINANIRNNQAYQSWFTSRFKYTVFENEMKWNYNEKIQGQEDYSDPDAMMQFAKSNGVSVRGHNIFWDDSTYNPTWVTTLSPADLKKAADKRINSIVKRYKGQVIHWDVVNENLNHDFMEGKLGPKVTDAYYQTARAYDPDATPFLNDFSTIENNQKDQKASPANYKKKIMEIRQDGNYKGPLGIGLQGHFGIPDVAYIRASLDMLATEKLPIWITELDISKSQNQARYLNQTMKELHSHPAVNAIVLWTAWSPSGCYEMCLTDNTFKNLPAGDVVDKILGEWKMLDGLTGTTDANGYFETSLHHGDYQVQINHPEEDQLMSSFSSPSINFKVAPTTNHEMLNVKLPTLST